MKTKLIRTATIPNSLARLLKGQLSFLNQHFEVVAVSGENENLQTVRECEGVRSVDIAMQRSISPLNDLRSLWQLYCLFRKEKPQIVHSITPKAGLLTMLAGKLAGVPIRIHTFTGLIFPTKTGFFQKTLIFMDRILCLCATNIYPEGKGVRDDLIKYSITSKSLKVIGNGNVNGIDLEYFSRKQVHFSVSEALKNELNIEVHDFVFVFVGRLVGDKGINELISSFQKVLCDKKNVKLLLVGTFESDLDPLQVETLNEINSNPNIIWVGYQNDVRPYFAISDALVFPSYREGFPNVVMQAGAMELPAIVTDINGCNEIIIEGQNGTIIPARDAVALGNGMLKLMEDKVFYDQLKSNARDMIASRYQQKLVWEAILEEYKRLEKNV